MEQDMEVEKYYIGIYDPKTGEMVVHPAPRVHIRREIKSLREKDAELAKRNTVGDGVGSLPIRLRTGDADIMCSIPLLVRSSERNSVQRSPGRR